jgi:hypothetical protein
MPLTVAVMAQSGRAIDANDTKEAAVAPPCMKAGEVTRSTSLVTATAALSALCPSAEGIVESNSVMEGRVLRSCEQTWCSERFAAGMV